jgi:membrane-bound serine protease (ClpP class)
MSRLTMAAVAVCLATAARASGPVVRQITFDTDINGATAQRITDAIDAADAAGDALVILVLDTPGGSVEATETVVKRMLAAKTPIAAWVGPSGARAASGGFFLLIAADVASMAPGTRTGAASVVYGMQESKEGDVLLKKQQNDLAALARSIAEHRGRNVESCEKAVQSAESYTDRDAIDAKLVDLAAKNPEDLVHRLDGRTIKRFDGGSVTLALAGATVLENERTQRQRVEERVGGFLQSPTVVYLLFLIGLAGLYAEFNHPGAIVPGVVGGIALILFAFAARGLPISALGLLLVLLGLVLFVLEIKVVSHGLLTVAGTACVVGGSLLLFPGASRDLRPPLALVLPGSLTFAALCAFATRLAWKAQRTQVQTGVEGLAGEVGVVESDLAPEGTVFVHGELWRATAAGGPVPAGTRVRIVRVRDLVVDVEPVERAS